jgi:prophage regulatory protein
MASNPKRPILRLPQKLKPTPYPPEKALQTLAAQLAGEQAYAEAQASTNAPGVRPPKQGPLAASVAAGSRSPRRGRQHGPAVIDLSQPGFLRLEQILSIYPVSRASWYAGIGTIYPESVRIGVRSVAWRTEDIRRLVECPPDFDGANRVPEAPQNLPSPR